MDITHTHGSGLKLDISINGHTKGTIKVCEECGEPLEPFQPGCPHTRRERWAVTTPEAEQGYKSAWRCTNCSDRALTTDPGF